MYYRGHLFTGDNLVILRSKFLQTVVSQMQDMYPFNNHDLKEHSEEICHKLIKKYSVYSKNASNSRPSSK